MKRILCLLMLLVIGFGQVLFAQTKSISGTVIGKSDGLSIPGASVMVKDSNNGTITMFDGTYTIEVDNDAKVLVYSFVGMRTVEVNIGDKTVINVELEDDAVAVDEVVVTAYGSKGKVGLKGAITTVSAKEIEQMPVATFDQMLQGKTTGLQVTAASGQPGDFNTRVRIRGSGSINASNDPLYIIDGVPIQAGDFGTLNANDFENVTILKDAAATSIYGSRASNGVILITTKRGKEGKTSVNYRYQLGFSQQTSNDFDMMNSSEKLWFEEFAQKGGVGWDLSPKNPDNANISNELAQKHEDELNRLRAVNTDWRDELLRTGKTESHEFNMSGGSDKTKFYISYQNYSNEGMALRSDLRRNVGRLNLDHEISDKVRFLVTSSIGHSKSNRIEDQGAASLQNPFAAIYLANPYESLYDDNGELNRGYYTFPPNEERSDYGWYQMVGPNAYDAIIYNSNNFEDTKIVGAVSLEWDVLKNLTFKSKYGIDYRVTQTERMIHPDAFRSEQVKLQDPNAPTRDGSLSKGVSNWQETNWANTLDYKSMIGEKHLLGAVLGTELVQRENSGWGNTAYGLNPKLPTSLGNTLPGTPGTADNPSNYFIPVVSGSSGERILMSVFLQSNYTYNEKYTLTASVRRDGSSAFGENNQHVILYSAGFIWDISREGFIQDATWVNNIKLRTSFGTTGNQEGIGDFESRILWGTNTYNGDRGFGLAHQGDPNLQWESAEKFNVGIDYNLFGNRLHGVIDYYYDVTSDLLLSEKLSATAGIPGNSRTINAGDVLNTGAELLINYDIIRSKNLYWSVGVNASYNHNEVLDLGEENEIVYGNTMLKEGEPMGLLRMKKWAGVNPANGDALYHTEEGLITNSFNQADYFTDFGSSIAPLTGGLNTSVGYKGLELSADFAFFAGNKRLNYTSVFLEEPQLAQYNKSRKMLDVWQKPGDITEVERIDQIRYITSKYLEDASFIRFRNAQLAYSVSPKLLERSRLFKALRIYAQGQNLFTWSKWSGFDPEGTGSTDQFPYPPTRTISFGIDARF